MSKIEFVNTSWSALHTAMLNRDVDALLAFYPDNVPILRSKGAKVDALEGRYAF